MRIRMISSGTMLDVNDSYGVRLCEQGKSVVVQDDPAAVTAAQGPIPTEAGGTGENAPMLADLELSQGDGKTRKGKKHGAER